jgi:hypothetical protein
MAFIGISITVVVILLAILTFAIISWVNINFIMVPSLNSLNAAGDNRIIATTTLGVGSTVFFVKIPNNACLKLVNYSMAPGANGVSATIKIGLPNMLPDAFGSATITNEDFDTGGFGQITKAVSVRLDDLGNLCSINNTVSAMISVIVTSVDSSVTSSDRVTFLFEVVSEGYYQTLTAS